MASKAKRVLPSGEIRYDVRWWTGSRQQRKSFRRSGDADRFLRRVQGDEVVGLVHDYRGGDVTLESFATGWLATRLVKGRPLAPRTADTYRYLLRRCILPYLGETRLRGSQPETIREWHSRVAQDLSADLAAKSYRLLRAIFTTAVDDGLLVRNPCRVKGGGTERAPERPMVDGATVLELANAMDPRYRALVLVAGLLGVRPGELLGLQVGDVDRLHGTLTIRRQAQEVSGAGRVIVTPKSEASRRTLTLPKYLADELGHHIDTYTRRSPTAVVFTGPKGGPLRRATMSKAWRRAREAVNAPPGLRLHDLRHHAATATARMPGITTKELMARIGHASPRAALIYQHATAERDAEIARYWDDLLAVVEERRATRDEMGRVISVSSPGPANPTPNRD